MGRMGGFRALVCVLLSLALVLVLGSGLLFAAVPAAPVLDKGITYATVQELIWDLGAADVTGYKVYKGGNLEKTVLGRYTTSASITGLVYSTEYTWTAKATNVSGDSSASNSVVETTAANDMLPTMAAVVAFVSAVIPKFLEPPLVYVVGLAVTGFGLGAVGAFFVRGRGRGRRRR